MRVFLDTNVLLSAFLWEGGVCDQVLRLVVERYDLVVGEVVIEEAKEKLAEKFKLSPEEIAVFEAEVRGFDVVARPEAPATAPLPDPDDLWVLASALDAEAAVLVTGDKGFRDAAAEVPSIQILRPREFLDQYGA